MVGNFDSDLISTRCAAFESLLKIIANDSRLRESPAFVTFLQTVELNEAKHLLEENNYNLALNILETSFKLLNKVIFLLFWDFVTCNVYGNRNFYLFVIMCGHFLTGKCDCFPYMK